MFFRDNNDAPATPATGRQISHRRPRPIVLRNPAFGRIWISQLQSNLGTWLMVVAVPVYVFHLTGSPGSTSLALVAEASPALVFAPLGGVLADRWNRRLVMAGSDALRAGCVLGMLVAGDAGLVWVVYAAVFAENSFAAFFDPAYSAIIPQIVGRSADLDAAGAWSAAAGGAVRLAGGPLGGLLYAVAGFRWLVAADAATYLISAALVLSLRRAPRPAITLSHPAGQPSAAAPGHGPVSENQARPPTSVLTDLQAGLTYLARSPMLRGLLAVSSLFLFANGALTVVLVPFAVRMLHGGPRGVGLLMSALGAGYLAGACLGRRLARGGHVRGGTALCLIAETGAFAGLFNSASIGAALAFIALVGVPGAAILLLVRVGKQRAAPDRVLGRVSSAFGAAQMAATVLGAALGGVLASAIGIIALADAALGPVAAAAVLAWACLPSGRPAAEQPAVAAAAAGPGAAAAS